MTRRSQLGGSKPIRTVTYTSGTGTFSPLMANSWCRVTLVGGGGGSGSNTATNGAGAASSVAVTPLIRVAGATAYAVGAGGVASTSTLGGSGGTTSFGAIQQPGGSGGNSTAVNGTLPASAVNAGLGIIGTTSAGHIGGSNFYGQAGATKGAAGTGYGAGGSGDGTVAVNGTGGVLIIEEFGA